MIAFLSSPASAGASGNSFDPANIRRTVERAMKKGLIVNAGQSVPIDKSGAAAAVLEGTRSHWIDVSPVTAAHWLQNNFRNRPVSDDVVDAYARDMLNGVWIPTHQGIAFNDKDELIDGQHRLLAIVKCGKTIRTMVTFGLASKIDGHAMTTMDAVDRGRTRSVADQLKIQHGMKNGSVIAATSALISGLCYGERTRRISVGQTLEIYRAYQGPMTWVIERRSKQPGLKATGVIAAFTFALSTVDTHPENKVIGSMFELLMNSGTMKPNTGMSALSEFLQSDESRLLSRSTDRGLSEVVMEAIRIDLRGERVKHLQVTTSGADYFRSLQPDRVSKIKAMFVIGKS